MHDSGAHGEVRCACQWNTRRGLLCLTVGHRELGRIRGKIGCEQGSLANFDDLERP